MNTNTSHRGALVVVEGIDGSGKSSVVRALTAHLEAAGHTVVASSEPTRKGWGAKVRATFAGGRYPPEIEADYLVRDRRDHVAELIEPALAAGQTVVLDRYYPSTVAYQGAAGLCVDELLAANDFAPRPDALVVLDLPVDAALGRIRARGDVPNAMEQPASLERCRAIFLGFVDHGAAIIDAARPVEAVVADVLSAVDRQLAVPPNKKGRP